MAIPKTISFVDRETGEIHELEVRVPRARRTMMRSLYKRDWSVIHRSALRELAADKELRKETMRVFLHLLGSFENENRIFVSYQAIAVELGIHPTAASRSLGLLASKGILIGTRATGFTFDPHYGFRGDPTGVAQRRPDGRVVLLNSLMQ